MANPNERPVNPNKNESPMNNPNVRSAVRTQPEVSTVNYVSTDGSLGIGRSSSTGSGTPVYAENELVQTKARADIVSQWVADVLANRNIMQGSFRADPRLDVFDKITAKDKYVSEVMYVTNFKLTYNGAFRGSYEGRLITNGI